MIRLATTDDIPFITQGMFALKAYTGWAKYDQPRYTRESLRVFLHERLLDRDSVLYVSEVDSLQAFCGGSLQRLYLPPHMLGVLEWGLWGEPMACARCWLAVEGWGRKRGAELSGRVKAKPGEKPDIIEEHVVWKVLK